MKVHEIATELKIENKELITFLFQQGLRIKTPNHKLDPGTSAKMIRLYRELKKKRETEAKPLPEKTISIKDESLKISVIPDLFGYPLPDIMKIFLSKGLLVNINSEVTIETLTEIAKEFNITIEVEDTQIEKEIGLKTKVLEIEEEALKNNSETTTRPPIIAIMGHVDHGKTLLLDKIRKANVISSEAGGITQHIGAYQITHNDNKLTFLDTPGHEAFTALRARGAQVTDIAILVVSATEGIKPQTVEAINHAQAADIPIIVAINKIDLPDANPDKVKEALTQHNLVAEDWGGSTVMVPVSAKTEQGIPDLLEMITLVAEVQDLKGTATGKTKAVIIEANLSNQKGAIATVIVKSGSLKVGDLIAVDGFYGKTRAIINDKNERIKELLPGDPGEILGLPEVPSPGAILETFDTEKECKKYVDEKKAEHDSLKNSQQKMAVSLEALSTQAEDGNLRQVNLIIKADVQGSLEAIKGSIEKIDSKDIPIKIIHSSTGSINENDVLLAKASEGIIFGFNSTANAEAKKVAQLEKITIKSYKVIYEILEDIEKVIQGLYKPEFFEEEAGKAEVRQLFKFSKIGTIAGCYVTQGKINHKCQIRIVRNKEVIEETTIKSLKRFKEDVKDVAEGYECGIVVEDNFVLQEGDIIEAFQIKQKTFK
ncbi:translation initiation factor IF-2 [Candidatus Marinamargulisbacteria bacterium SCGC AG-414-C22]|nr:translation initiation factor IF-2 [Candidatus Marinamargulisbacteria bacterium SCGC AG-414-C22]